MVGLLLWPSGQLVSVCLTNVQGAAVVALAHFAKSRCVDAQGAGGVLGRPRLRRPS